MAKVLIKDGYTLNKPVKTDGFPDVQIEYRPALPEAVYEFWQTPKPDGKARLAATIAFLLKHVTGWDATEEGSDNDAKPVKLDEASLRRVPAPILERMVDTVVYPPKDREADLKNSQPA